MSSARGFSVRCSNAKSYCALRRQSPHSAMGSAVGGLMVERSIISMPGATRSFSTCWAIPPWLFRSATPPKVCPSECRSSGGHGKKNKSCLSLLHWRGNAARGRSRRLREERHNNGLRFTLCSLDSLWLNLYSNDSPMVSSSCRCVSGGVWTVRNRSSDSAERQSRGGRAPEQSWRRLHEPATFRERTQVLSGSGEA